MSFTYYKSGKWKKKAVIKKPFMEYADDEGDDVKDIRVAEEFKLSEENA